GFGAVLMASAEAFLVLKWVGAAYLVYLGIQMWRAPAQPLAAIGEAATGSVWEAIGHAFTVTVLNPKGIIFFGAFLPQFIVPSAPALPQLLILAATFVTLATTILGTYALLMGNARRLLASPTGLRRMQRTGGTLLIGAGILTATIRRAA
ncbi:MAG TPA: LysE family transporter, partial [bacterium]